MLVLAVGLQVQLLKELYQIRELGQDKFATDDEGRHRSTLRCDPIDRLVPGSFNVQAYPEIVLKYDADGKLERFNLWTLRQSLNKLGKLNRDIFTLTCSRQIPP